MNYTTSSLSVKELIDLIDDGKIDLKPSYQRNEVWTRKDQESLIDSILSNYPLPNFFFYKNDTGVIEMVDGQQRARAIYSFYKGLISNSKKTYLNSINESQFFNYLINITNITEVYNEDAIRKFYVLVNKKGIQLNNPEIFKAQFAATKFLELVEELLEDQNFSNLELFNDSTTRRMNDRSYVEELVAYLLLGISDKKLAVEKVYESDISEYQYHELKSKFQNIIERLQILNNHFTINQTRYKQRNDFYTLFNFVNEGLIIDTISTLMYQYRILLVLDKYISPSNDECKSIQNYAHNCVSQSNSKKARLERLTFFDKILRNKNTNENEVFKDVSNFLFDAQEIKKNIIINSYILFDLENE